MLRPLWGVLGTIFYGVEILTMALMEQFVSLLNVGHESEKQGLDLIFRVKQQSTGRLTGQMLYTISKPKLIMI